MINRNRSLVYDANGVLVASKKAFRISRGTFRAKVYERNWRSRLSRLRSGS